MRFRILFLIVFFICSFGFASNPYDSKLTELAQRIEKTDYQTQQRILKKLYIHAHEHTNEDMREIVRNFIAMLSLKENDMSNYATKINA
ncbi:hypothetical protein GW750_08190 [bacterium]|nr:hypothetical protein [bacterium]